MGTLPTVFTIRSSSDESSLSSARSTPVSTSSDARLGDDVGDLICC